MPYLVSKWDEFFEVAKTRNVRLKSWGAYPVKQGQGYMRLVSNASGAPCEHGAALLGAWVSIVRYLHTRPVETRKGYLTDTGDAGGRPMDAAAFQFATHIPADLIQEAIDVAVDAGWLTWQDENGAGPPPCPTTRKPRVKGAKKADPLPPRKRIKFVKDGDAPFPDCGVIVGVTPADLVEWRREYPDVVVEDVIRLCRNWFRRGRRRKTVYPTLLTFLEGEQDKGAKAKTNGAHVNGHGSKVRTPHQLKEAIEENRQHAARLVSRYQLDAGAEYDHGNKDPKTGAPSVRYPNRGKYPDKWAEVLDCREKIENLRAQIRQFS